MRSAESRPAASRQTCQGAFGAALGNGLAGGAIAVMGSG